MMQYEHYLQGWKWQFKREQIKKRSGGLCERCHTNPARDVHHLTYRRIYKEKPSDLLHVCKLCHTYLHPGKQRTWLDPDKDP